MCVQFSYYYFYFIFLFILLFYFFLFIFLLPFRVDSFEYTPELTVFDLLHISLYHGWLLDPALPQHVEAIGSLTYNQLVEFIIENQQSTEPDKQTKGKITHPLTTYT